MIALLGCKSHAQEFSDALDQHLHRSAGASANERHNDNTMRAKR